MPKKHAVGRPTVFTRSCLDKLEKAFSLGSTDKEACLYAGISPDALYDYQAKNPAFIQRKDLLKQNPILKARTTIVDALKKDVNTARWFLERRDSDFNAKSSVDITTDGEPLVFSHEQIISVAKSTIEGTGPDGGAAIQA